MKKNINQIRLIQFLIILFLGLSLQNFAQEKVQSSSNNSFSVGEELKFKIYFHSTLTGNLKAGHAKLTIDSTHSMFDDNIYSINAYGETKGIIKLFYKIRDRFTSYFNMNNQKPIAFVKDVKEGKYQKYDSVFFDYTNLKAFGTFDTVNINPNITDVVSSIYYLRNLELDNLQIGDSILIPIFIDDEILSSNIKFVGYDFIETDAGKFKCLKFDPFVNTKSYFKGDELGTIWISNDNNHLPVLVESELKVGSIKLELVNAEGLTHPISIVKK